MASLLSYDRLRVHAAFCVAFAVGIPAFFYLAHQEINHDTGWFMYAARGLLAGGQLYKDFVDVNAPMAYYSVMLAAWLSNFSFLTNETALTINIFIYIFIAYALCATLLKRMGFSPGTYAVLCAAFLIVLCLIPNYGFGQREHIFGVLLVPYALAAGLRTDGKNLPRNLAIACGIAAGFGASIKPQYILVPAFIELAVLTRAQWKIRLTADLVALGATLAVIYALSIVCYPEYWTTIVPQAAALYGPYDNFWFLSDALLVLVPLFVVGFGAGEYRGRGPLIGARWMMVAATLGTFVLFVVQRKGWPHHAVPIMIVMSCLFLLNLGDIARQAAQNRTAATIRGGISVVVLAASFYLAWISGNVNPEMMANVKDRLRDTDGSYYIFSTGNYPAFPIGLDRRYTWTSRFPQLILLPGLADLDLHGETSTWEPWFRQAVLDDIQKGKPSSIFIYNYQDAGMPENYGMLKWFMRDPAFADEWKHYRLKETVDAFTLYVRDRK